MSNRYGLLGVTLVLTLLWAARAQAQHSAEAAPGRNMAEMKFVTFPGLPTCATGSVQNGDPTKGPSVILIKSAAGCTVPWHWHTPNENLMIVSGVAKVEMKDGKALTLRAGGYANMPSQHVHQFHSSVACAFFIYSDGAFDIHYVDAQGKEIPPADALKAVKETAATEMK
jgi:quercetin dioxygenase-like cupin family protein